MPIATVPIVYPAPLYSRFIVGHDSRGRWVVRDTKGLVGGMFTDRDSAVHFARAECGHLPGSICCMPDDAVISLGPAFEAPGEIAER